MPSLNVPSGWSKPYYLNPPILQAVIVIKNRPGYKESNSKVGNGTEGLPLGFIGGQLI
jgi:hypothetical protein